MDSIRFVTRNQQKLGLAREAFSDLDLDVRKATAELTEPQTTDVETVARETAEQAMESVALPLLVADTGFLLPALDGFPGALLKPVTDSIGAEGLCRLMEDENDRRTVFRSVAAYAGPDGDITAFSCDDRGRMARAPTGDRRDAWGPVMRLHRPDGFDLTLASMPDAMFADYQDSLEDHYSKLADWLAGERS